MLSGLFKSRQSIDVGGPIGSMADAKSDAPMANPDYTAAYLAKRLSKNPDLGPQIDKKIDRYRPDELIPELQFDHAEKTAFLLNSTKDYEAEAEECLKKEFKDWLTGMHQDNAEPEVYDNGAGGMVRRDMRGEPLNGWHPTWWGTKQLTHLPGVREYLREDYSSQDKHSFDMNMLAQFGPSNLEEAWAYFKYWVKRRPVGPWKCLTGTRYDEPFERSGPFSMAPAQMDERGTMPEISMREGENPSLVDKALMRANLKALRKSQAALMKSAKETTDAFTKAKAEADLEKFRAERNADPFQSRFIQSITSGIGTHYMNLTFAEHKDILDEQERNYKAELMKAPVGADVTWRAMMKDRRPMTREQYNRQVIWTGPSEETDWYDKFAEELKAADIDDADRNEITEMLKQKYQFEKFNIMTFSDHYLNDKIIRESSEFELTGAKQRQRARARRAAQDAQDAENARLLAEQQAKQKQEALEKAQKQKELDARVDAALAKRLAELSPEQQAALQKLLADTGEPPSNEILTPGTPVRVNLDGRRGRRLARVEEVTEDEGSVSASDAPTPVRPRATASSSSAAPLGSPERLAEIVANREEQARKEAQAVQAASIEAQRKRLKKTGRDTHK